MATQPSRVPIPGSERLGPVHEPIGACDPTEVATVTVYIRGSGDAPVAGWLSREEYTSAHGAAPGDVDAVRSFAEAHAVVGWIGRPCAPQCPAHRQPRFAEHRLRHHLDDVPRCGRRRVSREAGQPLGPVRTGRSRHRGVRARRSSTGTTAIPSSSQCAVAVHAAAGCRRLRVSARIDRKRRVHCADRAGRGLSPGGSHRLFLAAGTDGADRGRGAGRRREQQSGHTGRT